MLRNLVVSSTTAAVFGLTSATIGAMTFGTAAIPFICGTTAGFMFGAYSHYRSCVLESAQLFKDFPDLFNYHIRIGYPASYRQHQFSNVIDDGWVAKSMAIGTLSSASDNLTEIRNLQEQRLIEKYGGQWTELKENEE